MTAEVTNTISEELNVLEESRLEEIIVLVDIVNDIYFYYQGQVYGFIDELISVMTPNEEEVFEVLFSTKEEEEIAINQGLKKKEV